MYLGKQVTALILKGIGGLRLGLITQMRLIAGVIRGYKGFIQESGRKFD